MIVKLQMKTIDREWKCERTVRAATIAFGDEPNPLKYWSELDRRPAVRFLNHPSRITRIVQAGAYRPRGAVALSIGKRGRP